MAEDIDPPSITDSGTMEPPPDGAQGDNKEIPNRPGIVISGLPPDPNRIIDKEHLEFIFYKASVEGNIKIKQVLFSEDRQLAYVEFEDSSVIPQVLSKHLSCRNSTLTVNEIDLMDIQRPYLIVSGLPPFVNKTLLKSHFEEEADKKEIESIEMNGCEAFIFYAHSKVALAVASKSHAIFGTPLQVRVDYKTFLPINENHALVITATGLPPAINLSMLKQPLEHYLHTASYHVESCYIVNGTAYILFPDPLDVDRIISKPPTSTFIAGCTLHYSAVPLSEVPGPCNIQMHGIESPGVPHIQDTCPSHIVSGSAASHPEITLDMNQPSPCDRPLSDASMLTKVLIKGIPTGHRDKRVVQYYLQSLHPSSDQCSVQLYDDVAVATFNVAINCDALTQKSTQRPFLDATPLTFSLVQPTDAILVSNIPESVSTNFLCCHFERITGRYSVREIKQLTSSQDLVFFKDSQCVQQVLAEPEHCLDGKVLTVLEYYSFMNVEELSPAVENPVSVPLSQVWSPQKKVITERQCKYLQRTLEQLKSALEPAGAHVVVQDTLPTKWIDINPSEHSANVPEWDTCVCQIAEQHFSDFKEELISVPEEALVQVYPYVYEQHSNPKVDLSLSNDKGEHILIISGSCAPVDEISEYISELCQASQITLRELPCSAMDIKYLESFCKRDLNSVSPPVSHYESDLNAQCIKVTANLTGHKAFKEIVEQKLSNTCKKEICLTPEKGMLLSSQRGISKMHEIISVSPIVYEFVEDCSADGVKSYKLVLVSPNKDCIKKASKTLKSCLESVTIPASQEKIRVCSDQNWRELVERLTDRNFASIDVVAEKCEIVVTGEKIIIGGIQEEIERFLIQETSVEERISMDYNCWKVIKMNFNNEIEEIKRRQKQSKGVVIAWPNPKIKLKEEKVHMLVRGEPAGVDDIKVQLEMLKRKVFTKDEKISRVPAIVPVLISLEDKIHTLENKQKVAITFTLERGDDSSSKIAKATGELPRKVCSATAPDGCRVSVFTGDFTQNQYAGTIVNFIGPDTSVMSSTFKLLSSAGGDEVEQDFRNKVSQFMDLKPSETFKTKHGQLKCTQLVHCILPLWKQDDPSTNYFLEEAIKKVFHSALPHGSLLITPVTSKPLQYPASVIAQMLIKVLTKGATAASFSETQVYIYIDELTQAKEFEELFTDSSFQIHTRVPTHTIANRSVLPVPCLYPNVSAKGIPGLNTFISVVNGDMFQQQADVYINSTNTNLNLNSGIVSKLFLKYCGDDLQKECSAYAPLNPGQVAVTDARNLKCKQIYHVALPDHSTRNSERVFRDTIKTILRTAMDSGVTSIAIPSLGVNNLKYPASISAKILFDEVIAFHAANPTVALQMFHFVIFEKEVYQVFNKEYVQQMSKASVPHAPSKAPHKQIADKSQHTKGCQLSIIQGNIADESSDVIVNTTTKDMNLSASDISKALSQKAGPNLVSACQQHVDSGITLEYGNVAATSGYNLRCKRVYHVFVPHRIAATTFDQYQLIEHVVTECLQKAEKERMKSVSFPAFGLGRGKYTVPEVAEPMLSALDKFGQTHPTSVNAIRVVILNPKQFQSFQEYHCKFFELDPTMVNSNHGITHTLKTMLGFGNSQDGTSVQLGSAHARYASQASSVLPDWALSCPISDPVAVFHIYAPSSLKCDNIAYHLRDMIKQTAITKKIEDARMLKDLIEDDIQDIQNIGDTHGVIVKLMTQINEVQISGEKSKVVEAKEKIQSILYNVQRTSLDLNLYQWQSEDGGDIEPYTEEASIRLERARAKHLQAIEMVIDGMCVIINLQTMQETDNITGAIRNVKRIRKPRVEYPITWVSETRQDGRPLQMEMFEVHFESPEYLDATKDFQATMTGYKYSIVCVKRIQNRKEYDKHVAFRDAIEKKHRKKVEERRLFHGSQLESLETIAYQGFNRNFAADANAACFGKGVYFALNARYSAQEKYSKPDPSGNQHMFVCNFIVGEYTKGNQSMKVAPALKSGSKEVFDTLVDNEQNPTIFVAMTDAQVYPEYLITFKVEKK